MTRWLVIHACAIGLGVFFQVELQPYIRWLLLLTGGLVVWQLLRADKRIGWSMAALWLLIAVLRAGQTAALPEPLAEVSGQFVQVSGIVQEAPEKTLTLKGEERLRLVLSLEKLGETKLDEKLTCYLPCQGARTLAVGSKISLEGKLKRASVYHNPGQPQTVGGVYRLSVTAWDNVKTEGEAGFWPGAAFSWRQQTRALLQTATAPQQAAVLEGLLFGGSSGIPAQWLEAFSNTGLVHILSVSGTHVALLLGAAFWLLRFFLPPGFAAAAAGLCGIFYGFVCGFSSPVVRSLLMGCLALGALYLEREGDVWGYLALAAGGLLLYEPALLADISFQLSFSATAGLIALSGPVRKRLKNFLPENVAGLLAVTVGAQAGSLPFLAWYFKSLSLASLPANLFAAPLLESVLLLGLCAALGGTFYLAAGKLIFAAAALLLNLAVLLVELLAQLPCATIYLPPFGLMAGGLYYLLLSVGFWRQIKPEARRQIAVVLTSLIFAVLFWRAEAQLEVHFIDVGQGDAILIKTPQGGSVLFDAGSGEEGGDLGRRVVAPYLKHQGIKELDYLIFSHAHDDHVGGGPAVAKNIGAKAMLLPVGAESAALKMTERLISTRVLRLEKGQRWELDGVSFEVLTPGQDGAVGNEASAVLRVAYGKCSFLLTGDLEGSAEESLVAEKGSKLASTVLKVGHHGARRATMQPLLEAVKPGYAVISVGAENSYGHPHQETLARLKAAGIKTYRTDLQGALLFKTDGASISAAGWRKDCNLP